MRTLRPTSAGMIILLSAVGLSGVVAAQGEPDPMAPASFTKTTELIEEAPRGNPMVLRDHQQVVAVEVTDPRASGLMTGGEVLMMTGMGVLTGEGGDDGLTLVMGEFMRANVADTNWGLILPTDQVPPIPDPVEPPTE